MRIKIRFRKNRRVPAVRNKNYSATYAKRKGLKLGPVSLGFISLLLFCLISLFYLAQSNQITTKGYLIRELEVEKEKVMSENETLQVEAARLESLSKMSEKADKLSMVPAKDIKYFEQGSGALVKK